MSKLPAEEVQRIENNAKAHAGTEPPREYIIKKLSYMDGATAEALRALERTDALKQKLISAAPYNLKELLEIIESQKHTEEVGE